MSAAASVAITLAACERDKASTASSQHVEVAATGSQSIDEAVGKAVAEILGTDLTMITPGSRFKEDLGADSLDSVEIVMALEEEFDIMIPDEEAEKMAKISDVTDYISRILAERRQRK